MWLYFGSILIIEISGVQEKVLEKFFFVKLIKHFKNPKFKYLTNLNDLNKMILVQITNILDVVENAIMKNR